MLPSESVSGMSFFCRNTGRFIRSIEELRPKPRSHRNASIFVQSCCHPSRIAAKSLICSYFCSLSSNLSGFIASPFNRRPFRVIGRTILSGRVVFMLTSTETRRRRSQIVFGTRSAVSVEQAWKDVFPSRAALLGGFRRASGSTKGQVRCLASITVSDWRRQTQSRLQPCQSNQECVSRPYEVECGFPHSHFNLLTHHP